MGGERRRIVWSALFEVDLTTTVGETKVKIVGGDTKP